MSRTKDRYARIAGKFWRHPKVLGLSDRALALWTRALSFSADQMTDGAVSRALLKTLGQRDTKAADELVAAGLWERVDGGGYVFHDYADHNVTADAWEKHKQRKAQDQRNSRARRDQKDPASPSLSPVTEQVTDQPVTRLPLDARTPGRQDAKTLSERDHSRGDLPQVARARVEPADSREWGLVIGRFGEAWTAKTGDAWMGVGQHGSRAAKVARMVAERPDGEAWLAASIAGFFASDDPFVAKTRWSFATWSHDPGRYVPARVEPTAAPRFEVLRSAGGLSDDEARETETLMRNLMGG